MPRRNPEPITLLLIAGAAVGGLLLFRRKKPAAVQPMVPMVHEPAAADQLHPDMVQCPVDTRLPAKAGYVIVCDRRTGQWSYQERPAAPCPTAQPPARAGYRLECHDGKWKYKKVVLRTAVPVTAAELVGRGPLVA